MATNLAIDDQLIEEAVSVGKHLTKKAAVTAALVEYIQHHKQMHIIDLFGTISYDPKYHYKKQRNKK
jgi:ribosomal protein S12 methylthiotransferase accessory factor YcaO